VLSFVSTLPAAELRNKQAVLETTEGTIVLDLLPDAAPNHVAYFITKVREGAFDGTSFHRVISMGMVQGGDGAPVVREVHARGVRELLHQVLHQASV